MASSDLASGSASLSQIVEGMILTRVNNRLFTLDFSECYCKYNIMVWCTRRSEFLKCPCLHLCLHFPTTHSLQLLTRYSLVIHLDVLFPQIPNFLLGRLGKQNLTMHKYTTYFAINNVSTARISDTSYPTTPPVQNISETFLKLTRYITVPSLTNCVIYYCSIVICRICGSSKDPLYLAESGNDHSQLGTDCE